MAGYGTFRSVLLPQLRIDLDVGEPFRGLDHVVREARIAAFVFPSIADTLPGGTKNCNKPVLDSYLVSEICDEFIDSDLGNIRPDTQYVREIKYLDLFTGSGHGWVAIAAKLPSALSIFFTTSAHFERS